MTARLTCRYDGCNEPATGGDQLRIDAARMLTVNYCERHKRAWEALPEIVNNGAGKCVMSGCGATVFAVHCCRRHYDQTKPWKMATALRFSATMPEVQPMSVAPPPVPEDLPVAPSPAPKESAGEATLPPIWQALDPGIAAAVELLRAEGLATIDSGDGYSKKECIEAGEALDYAHVFVRVPDGERADDIIANAKAIPWGDCGYRVPTVELLERAPESAASEPDIVGVLWDPGVLHLSDGAPHPLEARRDALVARLLAAGFVEEPRPDEPLRRFKATAWPVWVAVVPGGPAAEWDPDSAGLLVHAEADCARVEAAGQDRQGDADPVAAAIKLDWDSLGCCWFARTSAGSMYRPSPVGFMSAVQRNTGVSLDDHAWLAGSHAEIVAQPLPIGSPEALARRMLALHAELTAAKEAPAAPDDAEAPIAGFATEPRAFGPSVAPTLAEVQADRDHERQRANEFLAQAHDAEEALNIVSDALFSALGMEPDDTGTLRLLATVHSYIQTLRNDFRRVEEENREAVHLLQLLGVKVGTLPDMIAALLPRSRLLKLRIRNETAAALAIDNLSLQEVAEDDPRMVEAIRLHREATALRRAAEPPRDHSPDAGKMVQE